MELRVESPFPEHAVPRIWMWTREFRNRVADDFAPKTLEEFVQEWQTSQQRGRRTWAVYRDGELGGLVTFDTWSPMVGTTHCLFMKRFWGQATTLPALQETYRQIFETTGVSKLMSFGFADNWQLIGMARKLGAHREGWLRQQTMRGGKPVDMVVLGLLREEFDAIHGSGGAVDHGGIDRGGNGSRCVGEPQKRPDTDHGPEQDDKRNGDDAPEAAA